MQTLTDFDNLLYVPLPNGEQIAYRQIGKGQQTIIFVHGNMISSLYWKPLINNIDLTKFNCFFIDLRGFGHSTYMQPIDKIQDFAQDIHSFIQALNLNNPALVGWSLGGCIVQNLVCLYPDQYKKLILVASGNTRGFPLMIPSKQYPEAQVKASTKQEVLVSDKVKGIMAVYQQKNKAFLRNIFDMLIFNKKGKPSNEEEYNNYFEETFLQRNYGDVVHALNHYNITNEEGADGIIGNFKGKVLIYQGGSDLVINALVAHNIQKDFGNEKCRLIIRDEHGHSPVFDDPLDLYNQINNFLDDFQSNPKNYSE